MAMDDVEGTVEGGGQHRLGEASVQLDDPIGEGPLHGEMDPVVGDAINDLYLELVGRALGEEMHLVAKGCKRFRKLRDVDAKAAHVDRVERLPRELGDLHLHLSSPGLPRRAIQPPTCVSMVQTSPCQGQRAVVTEAGNPRTCLTTLGVGPTRGDMAPRHRRTFSQRVHLPNLVSER